jgi:hypothetical protein
MNPHWDFTWWISAAAAGEVGDKAKSGKAFDHLSRLRPGEAIEFPAFNVFTDPARRELILRGLMKTGLWAVS